ncbi:MAG: hypothetical protein CVU57_15220, partial [Deltaproteobacteria bacterium HGW-Deltaproteobacteria-15]
MRTLRELIGSLFLLMAILAGSPSIVFAEASGSMKASIAADENGRMTSFNVHAILSNDTTHHWDISMWIATYAQIDCYVDGQFVGGIGNIISNGPGREIWPKETMISYWPPMTPGVHKVTYKVMDVYGVPYSYWFSYRIGNVITEYSVTVRVASDGGRYLQFDEKLNLGYACALRSNMVGDPINAGTGNKVEQERDLTFYSAGNPLEFTRTYNSRSNYDGPMGYGWTHNYNIKLTPVDAMHVEIMTSEGNSRTFFKNPENNYQELSSQVSLVKEIKSGETTIGWLWEQHDGRTCEFDASGKLQKTTHNDREMEFSYNMDGFLAHITDLTSSRGFNVFYNSDGLISEIRNLSDDPPLVSYQYDSNRNLTIVNYSDGAGLEYTYNDPHDPHNMTEKRNKMGHFIANWTYDDKDRAVVNESRDGKGVSIEYTGYNKAQVTDDYGKTRIIRFVTLNDEQLFNDVEGSGSCANCAGDIILKKYNYDSGVSEVQYANGRIDQYSDFDSKGNPRTQIRALGTAEEKILQRTYHPDTGESLTQTELSVLGDGNRITIFDYDSDGNDIANENPTKLVHRRIEKGYTKDEEGIIVPYQYITTYTYNERGQLLSMDGPLSGIGDRIAFTYFGNGDLQAVERPGIGITAYSDYDSAGRVGRITDPNGSALTFTYDGRGRIGSRTRVPGEATETFQYNIAGDIETVTMADGSNITYEYDAEYGRPVRMIDSLGNYISSAYDAQGNRIEVKHYWPNNERAQWKRFDYNHPDHPGKLWKEIYPDDSFTQYSYDTVGNLQTVRDPFERLTQYEHDVLSRLQSVIQPGDVVTSYAYDRLDNLIRVTDAENHPTTYTYDDLGRLLSTLSPDTNLTAYTYDAAGNLLSKTDANGITASYTYDGLNRLTRISYPDSSQD